MCRWSPAQNTMCEAVHCTGDIEKRTWKRLTQCSRLCWVCPPCSKHRQGANCGKERSKRGGAGSILHVISDQFFSTCQVDISVWASLKFLFHGSYSLLAHLFSVSSGAEYGALYLMDCFSALLFFLYEKGIVSGYKQVHFYQMKSKLRTSYIRYTNFGIVK